MMHPYRLRVFYCYTGLKAQSFFIPVRISALPCHKESFIITVIRFLLDLDATCR